MTGSLCVGRTVIKGENAGALYTQPQKSVAQQTPLHPERRQQYRGEGAVAGQRRETEWPTALFFTV